MGSLSCQTARGNSRTGSLNCRTAHEKSRTGGPNRWPKQPHGFSWRVKQEPQKSDALAGYTARENFRTGRRQKRHYGLRNNSKGLWNVDAENSFTAWLSFRTDTLFVSFAAEHQSFW